MNREIGKRILVLGLIFTCFIVLGFLSMKGIIKFHSKYAINPLKLESWGDIFRFSGIFVLVVFVYYWSWFRKPFLKKGVEASSESSSGQD